MNPIFLILLVGVWLYGLRALSKAKLEFWRYFYGAMGLFILLLVGLQEVLTLPLARGVAALAGLVGDWTGTFTAYLKYGIIFIATEGGSMSLQIDMECSGIIEIMAFLSLLAFFRVYSVYERVVVGVLGTAFVMVCNALRIVLICEAVHFMGTDAYFVAHTFLGRIFFYGLTVLLYFYVFTKPHIVGMKVGKFSYDNPKSTT